MGFRIAVDTGGTFSDVVLTDDSGAMSLTKAPTTPSRIFDGVSRALTYAAEEHGLDLEGLLTRAEVLIYATTRSTNAILTKTTARTALLTTQGFGDVLVFREGGKMRPFDFRQRYPDPYIPRRLTFELAERIDSEGEVVIPIDPDQVVEQLRRAAALDVEAIAVSLLWSIENPAHEELVGELIEAELPGVSYTLSHRLNPVIREYRRTSSAAIDASLKPLMQAHLEEMDQDLRAAGFDGELLVVTSFGGVLGVTDVAGRPIYSVNSGPAMAPLAGRIAAATEQNVVVCDTGGTSFDVSVVRDGEVSYTRETWLDEVFTGHITGLSSVDVKNVGAGGGSVAWLDQGGLIRVGPQSAGAEPGPVCYGRGGTEPTVTDAAVVLGYIDPDYFLGGLLKLDVGGARDAVTRQIAGPLGMSVERAAWAILAIANEHMVTAVRDITINQGIDPRESVLVAGGGAGGLTMTQIAAELDCDRVLVPRTAAALSACGGLFSDVVTEFVASQRADTGDFAFDDVNRALAELEARMDEFFERLGVDEDVRVKEFSVEARYPFQIWELDVPLASARFEGTGDVQRLVADFHAAHERMFAVKEPDQRVECLLWKARATVRLPRPDPVALSPNGGGPPRPRSTRRTWWGEATPRDVGAFDGAELRPGHELEGPALVELPTTTVVVYPDWSLTVTDAGEFMLTRAASEREANGAIA